MVNSNTFIIWDGILEATEKAGGGFDVVWYGTLFDHEDQPNAKKVAAPVRNAFKAFCDSDKEFRITGTAVPADGVNDGNKFKLYRLQFNGGEGWELDGKKHVDQTFEVLASLQWKGSPDPREALCYATGTDEYGTFIGTGWMRPGNRITLARRYVQDDRAQWNATQVQQKVITQVYDEEEDEVVSPPWKCNVLSA